MELHPELDGVFDSLLIFFYSGLFDRDNSGTIQLHEFQSLWNYIQQWKGVFERFDSNRSGSIEAAELMQGM